MQNLRKGVLIVGFCLFLFALATDNAYLMEGVVGMWPI